MGETQMPKPFLPEGQEWEYGEYVCQKCDKKFGVWGIRYSEKRWVSNHHRCPKCLAQEV